MSPKSSIQPSERYLRQQTRGLESRRSLEIRLVRDRHAVVEHTLVVLGAGFFINARPLDPAITVGGRPWLIEGVGIVNCKSDSKRLIVHQLPALHDVQLLRMRRAIIVHVSLAVQPDGVDNERIAFVMSD